MEPSIMVYTRGIACMSWGISLHIADENRLLDSTTPTSSRNDVSFSTFRNGSEQVYSYTRSNHAGVYMSCIKMHINIPNIIAATQGATCVLPSQHPTTITWGCRIGERSRECGDGVPLWIHWPLAGRGNGGWEYLILSHIHSLLHYINPPAEPSSVVTVGSVK